MPAGTRPLSLDHDPRRRDPAHRARPRLGLGRSCDVPSPRSCLRSRSSPPPATSRPARPRPAPGRRAGARRPAATERAAAERPSTSPTRVLDGRAAPRDPSATLALRDLWASLPAPRRGRAARAPRRCSPGRPTAGRPVRLRLHRRRSVKKCAKDVCVHWVTTHRRRPAQQDLGQAHPQARCRRVYARRRPAGYGYRKPLKDGNRRRQQEVRRLPQGHRPVRPLRLLRRRDPGAALPRHRLLRARQRLLAHAVPVLAAGRASRSPPPTSSSTPCSTPTTPRTTAG